MFLHCNCLPMAAAQKSFRSPLNRHIQLWLAVMKLKQNIKPIEIANDMFCPCIRPGIPYRSYTGLFFAQFLRLCLFLDYAVFIYTLTVDVNKSFRSIKAEEEVMFTPAVKKTSTSASYNLPIFFIKITDIAPVFSWCNYCHS